MAFVPAMLHLAQFWVGIGIVLAIATIAFVASLQRSMYRMVGSAMLNQLRVARERLADAGMLGADGQVEVAVEV